MLAENRIRGSEREPTRSFVTHPALSRVLDRLLCKRLYNEEQERGDHRIAILSYELKVLDPTPQET
jgi:hypothetical protein